MDIGYTYPQAITYNAYYDDKKNSVKVGVWSL